MKTATTALQNLLNGARAAIDAPIAFADCFTFTLKTGAILAYTNIDQAIVYNGATFSATGPLVQGIKYKCAVGLDVDKQQIMLAARPSDLLNGAPFLTAIAQGAFDGASFQRDRVFMSALGATPVGGVTLFKGRVSTIDSVGRTQAQLTVASDLVILDYDMPRNLWSPTCIHSLYDSGCGVVKGTYSASGAVQAGSTTMLINTAVALAAHAQGEIVFSSGVDANLTATIKSVVVGTSLTLMYPLPNAPAIGDGFTVSFGCPHTQAACQSRFNNLSNFRGFPYVPPPQMAF